MKTLEGLIVGVSASTEKPKKTKVCTELLSTPVHDKQSDICTESVPLYQYYVLHPVYMSFKHNND